MSLPGKAGRFRRHRNLKRIEWVKGTDYAEVLSVMREAANLSMPEDIRCVRARAFRGGGGW